MWRLSLVTCSLLAVLWSPLADAQQAKPSSGKDKWSQYEVKGNATIPAKDVSKPRLLCYAFRKNTNLSVLAELGPSKRMSA